MRAAPLRWRVTRRAAGAAEVEAALAALGAGPGVYFGCDAGVAGLHPLQAALVDAPALALQLHADGAEISALDDFGAALLAHSALASVRALAGRGPGRSPLVAVRAFLAAFAAQGAGGVEGGAADTSAADPASRHALLIGALRFEAHRLATPPDESDASRPGADAPPGEARPGADPALGVLFFAPTLLRRAAEGAWARIDLRFEDPALERLRVERAAIASTAAAHPAAEHPSATRNDAAAEPRDDFPTGGYAEVVARAVGRLAQQPLVSLTLSQSFRRALGAASPVQAFAALRAANPAPATFCFNTGAGEFVFGASPDLQLQVRGRAIESFPVCGTVPRGHGPVGKAEALRRLLDEAVDAASLAVCTDALRNDLAPLCEPGSLRLLDRRRPLALATVVHTVDRLGGRLAGACDAWDAIVATAAPVMVTGTPRRLALDAIAALEASPRGWYGGLMVQVAADGDALVGTILRAAAVRDGVVEVRTGGDLLADSDPAREEHESRFKAVSLWRALGLAVPAALDATLAGAARTAVDALAAGPAGRRLPAAVALRDAGDPFAAAVAECLRGLRLALDPAAQPAVLIGPGARPGGGCERVVALGDAAARVLQGAGFAVEPIAPVHGRLFDCVPDPHGPAPSSRAFVAMRCATLAVRWDSTREPAGWSVWLRDRDDRPVALAHAGRRVVCLLLRPESLLSDELARDWLRAALAFAAA
jgi:anthranilate/para-aminobenzoate synthase component I